MRELDREDRLRDMEDRRLEREMDRQERREEREARECERQERRLLVNQLLGEGKTPAEVQVISQLIFGP